MRGLVVAVAMLAASSTVAAGAAKQPPSVYRAVRSCLVQHRFAISRERYSASTGWEMSAIAHWRVNGGSGLDQALVVVGASTHQAASIEARLLRLLRAVYGAHGLPDDVKNYVHRSGRVVSTWLFRPESVGNQRALRTCTQSR